MKNLARYAVFHDTTAPEPWIVFDRKEFNAAETARVGYRTNVIARCSTRAAARGAVRRLNEGRPL